MSVCHADGCPASRDRDEFERPVTVQHGSITQPVLGATGHHLLNRQREGTLTEHLQSWSLAELRRATSNINHERERVILLEQALGAVQDAIIHAYDRPGR
jgi:hypothetical protein